MGLAGAVLSNAVEPDAITAMEQITEPLHDYTIISKVTIHNNRVDISDATRPSAISSSFNLLTDSTAVEEKNSILGNLLEKAIVEIDKELEEDSSIQIEKEAEKRQQLEAEARAKTEEQRKAQAEAKVSRISSISIPLDCVSTSRIGRSTEQYSFSIICRTGCCRS